MRVPTILALLLPLLALGLAPACGGGSGGTGQMALSVTDAPFPVISDCVAAALIEIDGVQARNDQDGWVEVPLAGEDPTVVLDLLELRAGIAANVALGGVPTGAYSEVRLHIVDTTLEFTDGSPSQTFKVPSGMASGLKLKIDPPLLLASGQTANLMFDVSVAESFHTAGLGGEPTCDDLKAGETKVVFAPVVHVVNTDTSGLVAGTVVDDQAAPLGDVEVSAFDAGTVVVAGSVPVATTFSTPAGVEGVAEGSYALWLAPGTYDLYVRPQGATDPIQAATGVVVGEGAVLTGQDLVVPAP